MSRRPRHFGLILTRSCFGLIHGCGNASSICSEGGPKTTLTSQKKKTCEKKNYINN